MRSPPMIAPRIPGVDVTLLAGLGADGSADPIVAQQVARAWLRGGLVGLPTETVYGLSADAQDAEAVRRIYAAKGRPADHPLIVHVQGPQALSGWSLGSNVVAERLAAAFWPGALTLVVRRSPRASDLITGGQDTVALRCPDHRVALACLRALAEESGDPARGVAAPSANRFGRVSPTRASDVLDELGAHLDPARDLVVDGGPCRIGVESTIVDCTAVPPRVLRLGAISQQQVDEVLAGPVAGQVADGVAAHGASGTRDAASAGPAASVADPAVAAGRRSLAGPAVGPADPAVGPAGPAPVRAPGTLEAHYSPRARVLLVDRAPATPQPPARGVDNQDPCRLATLEGQQPARITELAGIGEDGQVGGVGLIARAEVATPAGWTRLAAPVTAEEYARDLYAALRRADELGLATVVAVLPDPGGGPLAHAVRDRLARAAHGA